MGKLISPVDLSKHRLTSGFGNRKNPFNGSNDYHGGVDLAPNNGMPSDIFAVADGVVTFAGLGGEFTYAGKKYRNPEIYIDHGNGIVSQYIHMSNIAVRAGERVKAGQFIGRTGKEGAATGIHLHFGLRINGVYVDGWPYIQGKEINLPVVNTNNQNQINMPTTTNNNLKPWQYQVKRGPWISNVVQELIESNLGVFPALGDNANSYALFTQLNLELYHNSKNEYATPTGGFKPGMIVNWRQPDSDISPTVVTAVATDEIKNLQAQVEQKEKELQAEKEANKNLLYENEKLKTPSPVQTVDAPVDSEHSHDDGQVIPENSGVTQVDIDFSNTIKLSELKPFKVRFIEWWNKQGELFRYGVPVVVSWITPVLSSLVVFLVTKDLTLTVGTGTVTLFPKDQIQSYIIAGLRKLQDEANEYYRSEIGNLK